MRVNNLGTFSRGHALLNNIPIMRDLADEDTVRVPLVGCQGQVEAGHKLVGCLFGRPGGLHNLSDRSAICLPGQSHITGVEVTH